MNGLPACNGWTYWHYEDESRGLHPIDELRARLRREIEAAFPDAGPSSDSPA